MKLILIFLIILTCTNAKIIETLKWPNGESLITFLSKNDVPKDIYFNLAKEDQELCSEIKAGVKYQVSYKHDILEDILIPISEDIQIHIYKKQNKFILKMSPIKYNKLTSIVVVNIKNSPYEDILLTTHNYSLAREFVRNFKKSFNFRVLQVNDKIIIKYVQKIKLGNYYGIPEILSAAIIGKYKKKFIYKNPSDGRYYDNRGKSLTSVFFKVPLKYRRISSKFTRKRFHPILHRYIAHLGIDYAAPRGRKIRATAPGKIIFRGRKGGYGNTIIIRHKGGYKSLYAHQSKFASRLRRGSWVKQGQLIGYVGTTGRSTGPHLHFGLYKNGRAINPARVMSYSKKTLYGKTRKNFLRFAKKTKKELLSSLNSKKIPLNIESYKYSNNIDLNITNNKSYIIQVL